jgi:hypothetical protein
MTANVVIETAKRDNVLRIANDALRYKPRGESRWDGRGADRSARADRFIGRLQDDLQLTDAQESALKAEMAKLAEEQSVQGAGSILGRARDGSAMRQRVATRVEQVLGPLLTQAQRAMYEKWKQGRDTTRGNALWVIDATGGSPERRFVRTGVSDDQFTEIIGGQVKEGERAVVRAREAKS